LSENVIAIDGPAASGKSTVARLVANTTGFVYLDTGAMYRAVTLRAMRLGGDMTDPDALADIARQAKIDLQWTGDGTRVMLDGDDVTENIRTPDVTAQIYLIDQVPAVRAELVARQQKFGSAGRVVAEGRDIGTVVFPRARCKVFMEASLDERARRRCQDLLAAGTDSKLGDVRLAIAERDRKTMDRAVAPLRPAEDAVHIDTTHLTADQVAAAVLRLARERGIQW